MKTLKKIAYYARYSCDQQRETSIDDQLRRCREVAVRHGLNPDNCLEFKDMALSGTSKHQGKRDGYNSLLTAWDTGKFDVLIVDEFSRLTRDGLEQAKVIKRLEANARVRMITANGIDTLIDNWQLQVGLIGIVGQQAVRDTKHRVTRGMIGQLERGFMIATPPFGYDLDRHFDARGERIGTYWIIHEQNAKIVQEIFARRGNGESMHQIARWLNGEGIAPRRASRKSDTGYWRPAAIKNLLANTIYRGVFFWNGSITVKADAKRSGRILDTRQFDRPKLRLVSDELWFRCQKKEISRTGYGGGKHVLAGLVRCGCCHSTLVVSNTAKCPSLYCAACTIGNMVAFQAEKRMSSTICAAGVKELLSEALRYFLTPTFVDQFKSVLRSKLTGDRSQELATIEQNLRMVAHSLDRMSFTIANIRGADDPRLLKRYEELRETESQLKEKHARVQQAVAAIDIATIDSQLGVDPLAVLGGLFDADIPPEALRSLLSRLFPEIVFEGKKQRYESHFRLTFALGEALSAASDTPVSVGSQLTIRFTLRYRPVHKAGAQDGKFWTVIPDLPTDAVQLAA